MNRKHRPWAKLMIGLAILFGSTVVGCDRGPTTYTVSGEVTYQGQPVTNGQILFADVAAQTATARGVITDGRYRIETTAGEKKVMITATKETGKMIEGEMGSTYPEVIDLIPPRYNAATTLTTTVHPDKPLQADFNLE